jgi:hypothetical protein
MAQYQFVSKGKKMRNRFNTERKGFIGTFRDLVNKKPMFLAVPVIIGIGLAVSIYTKFQTETVQVKVTDKEKVISHTSNEDIESTYMIYTDKTTYTLNDSLIAFNFDTSDDYGKITKGKCYEFYVRGIRLPLFSWYQNIENQKEIKCQY